MIASGRRHSTRAPGHVPMLITGGKAGMASDVSLESLVRMKVKDQQQAGLESERMCKGDKKDVLG